jgi:hypothetical protein
LQEGREATALRVVEISYVVENVPHIHMDGFPAAIVMTQRLQRHGEEELKTMDFRS